MIDERALLREAIAWCKERHTGDIGPAISWRLYPERGEIVVVLTQGYKHIVPLSELRQRMMARAEAVEATPQARSLAIAHGVRLDQVRGTGEEGRVLVSDVRRHI